MLDDLDAQKAALAPHRGQARSRARPALRRARQAGRAEAGKDTGTVRFEDNGFVVIAELPKRVKWDQDKLRHAAEIIRTGWGDDPADYIKTKLEVSETAYANWPRPVRELFTPARTVETGRPVYRIETAHEATQSRRPERRSLPEQRRGSPFRKSGQAILRRRSTPRR